MHSLCIFPLKADNKLFSRYMLLKRTIFLLQKNDLKVRMTNGYSEMKHQPHFTLLEEISVTGKHLLRCNEIFVIYVACKKIFFLNMFE